MHFGFHNGESLHNKQLHDYTGLKAPVILKRSILGLVHVYNLLPQKVVDVQNVKLFQQQLRVLVKEVLDTDPKWEMLFHRP